MSLLQPTKTKYRKARKGRIRGKASKCTSLVYGEWGIKVLQPARISARQIEACRLAITRALGRDGKFWMRIFPHRPVTKKPLETRMGGGKGEVAGYEARVKPGTIIFELAGITESSAYEIFNSVSSKLPCKVKIVSSEDYFWNRLT